jgi:hypothetical protein
MRRYFDGAGWTERYAPPAPRPRRVSRWLVNLNTLVFGAIFVVGTWLCLYLAVDHLWGQLHGTSARVDLVDCTPHGKKVTCTGTARFPDGTRATVYIANGEGHYAGDTVDARVEGHDAYVNSVPNEIFSVIIPLLIGVVGISLQTYYGRKALTTRRRRNADQGAVPGHEHLYQQPDQVDGPPPIQRSRVGIYVITAILGVATIAAAIAIAVAAR